MTAPGVRFHHTLFRRTPRWQAGLLAAGLAVGCALGTETPEVPAAGQVPAALPDSETAEPHAGRHRASVPSVAMGGQRIVVAADEYVGGDLVLLGGSADIAGEVEGDLILIGSQAIVSGSVGGELVAVASRLELGDAAHIGRDLTTVFGSTIRGRSVGIGGESVQVDLIDLSGFAHGGSLFSFIAWMIFWIVLMKTAFQALAVAIVTALFARRIENAALSLPSAWGRSLITGLLVTVGLWFCMFLFAITVVGIPLAVLTSLGMSCVGWIGLASICCATGSQLSRNIFGRELSVFPRTMLGCLLFSILGFIPVFGWLLMVLVGLTGLGLMTVTRLGTRSPGSPLDLLTPSA